VSLKARLITYVVAIHLLFGALAVLLLRAQPYWLFAVELVFIVSIGVGVSLARRMVRSLSLGRDAARLIGEQELTSRFRDVGDPDTDALIAVYNRMVDSLRSERTRVQEQHHFFRQVLDASPSGLVILDFDRAVSEANPAAQRLLHLEPSAGIGLRMSDLASPLAARLSALPTGATEVVALTGPRRVRCHHGTFLDRGFQRHFFLIDELTEDLRQVERSAYEKLISVMSHEVNNTVTAANSLLQSSLTYAAELEPASRADFERAIGIVIGRTQQLSRFMRGFADVYRLPSPAREPLDLSTVVGGVIELVRASPSAAGVSWRTDLGAPIVVSADRGQLEQAFLNVLKNAVEAAGPGGTVVVRASLVRGRACVTVEDSGPGLSREAQENVFTPFFSTKPDGQGIGLTLVQEILAAHGCEFALESPPGGPTVFRVTF
jgi:signal transduction histidine kinase